VDDLLQALVHHVSVTLHGEDEQVRPSPLDTGGERRGPSVQRLDDLDVQFAGEGGVAPDAPDADGGPGLAEFLHHLDGRADGRRLAATRTEGVLTLDQQVGNEPRDGARRAGRRLRRGDDRE
jgi:hypothetical protein